MESIGLTPTESARSGFHADYVQPPWNSVMGTTRTRLKRPGSTNASASRHPWPMQIIVFCVMVFLLASPVWCRNNCKVDQCWEQYSRTLSQGKLEQSPTRAYCVVLKTHADCIRNTARGCRGDLTYHSTSSLVSQWTNEFNCSQVIMHGTLFPPTVTRIRPTGTSTHQPGGGGGGGGGGGSQACAYHGTGGPPLHCSLFGDPHLRTFDDRFQTCRVLGAWPLVDNAYLAVQVTNEAVMPGSSATATTKVTVVVKGADAGEERNPCAMPRTYEAQADQPLPSAFVDGTTSGGAERSIRVKEREDGAAVEITLRYVATTVLIRRVGRYLSVAVRMPRDVAHAGRLRDDSGSPSVSNRGGGGGLQLCLNGCPARERIDYKAALLYRPGSSQQQQQATLVMDREQAEATCSEYGVTDFYLDACVFDLMTTADVDFAHAAKKALHDLRTLNPSLAGGLANRTTLVTVPDTPSSVSDSFGDAGPPRGGSAPASSASSACRTVDARTTAALLLLCWMWWRTWTTAAGHSSRLFRAVS